MNESVATLAPFLWLTIAGASSALAQSPLLTELPRPYPIDQAGGLVTAGDVDGDGRVDVLLSVPLFYRNLPGPRFRDDSHLVANVEEWEDAALADVDGDGDLDLIAGMVLDDRLYLFDATSGFTAAPGSLGVGFTRELDAADVDGDGDVDYLSSGFANRLGLGDGAGGFVDASATLPAVTLGRGAFGDVDGDGDRDYLHTTGLLVNGGSGDFTDGSAGVSYGGLFWHPAPALGDFDLDGDLDAYWPSPDLDELHLNDGSGVFTAGAGLLPGLNEYSNGAAAADVDGDGDLDVVTAGYSSSVFNPDPNRLLINDGTATFAVSSAGLADNGEITTSIVLTDLDLDGDPDLITASGYQAIGGAFVAGGQDRLYLNDGVGTFADMTAPNALAETATSAVALLDLDGDSDLDAFVGGLLSRAIYRNDGVGRMELQDEVPSAAVADATPADFDGDGDVDLAIATASSFQLLTNDGAGGLTSTGLSGVAGQSVAAGDVDGDGDVDLYLGTPPGDLFTTLADGLLLGDGAGGFTDVGAIALPQGNTDTKQVSLRDVDGDGDLDVLAAGSSSALFLGDGSGAFSIGTPFLPATSNRTLEAADLDANGELDLYFGAEAFPGAQDLLFLSNGPLTYVDATSFLPPSPFPTNRTRLADLDLDGDVDILNSSPVQGLQVLSNDGSASFTQAADPLLGQARITQFALGDLDDDGDVDAFLGTDASFLDFVGGSGTIVRKQIDRVAVGLLRHLDVPDVASIGKTAWFGLHGGAGTPWALAASLNTSTTSLGALGVLKLDLAALIPLGSGMLGVDGSAQTGVPVPPVASLVGVELYFQALVDTPLVLTNAARVTLTDL